MNFIDINNNIRAFLKDKNADFTLKELIFFPVVILAMVFLSFYTNDNKIALISAICGITYTIFNGKGNIYCYFFGIIGTLCYSYLAFQNGLWGNFFLNFFYYFPLEIMGIFLWKKHLINKTQIKKTKLKQLQKYFYYGVSVVITIILAIIIKLYNFSFLNFLDFLTLFLSIMAMILAVKRCIEQWYYWTIVNFISVTIWSIAYLNGSNCLATVFMWGIYLILGIYFLFQWKTADK